MRTLTPAVFGLVCGLAMGSPLSAQSDADRLISALRATVQAPLPQATLRSVQADLLALLTEFPNSPFVDAILAVPAGEEHSLLQLVQAALAQPDNVLLGDESCKHKNLIEDLANRILAQRTEVGRFAHSRFGAEATYLWIRYAQPDFAAGIAHLKALLALGRSGPRRIEDLALSYAYANLPSNEAEAVFGFTPTHAFARNHRYALASLMIADEGKSYFTRLKRAIETGEVQDVDSLLLSTAIELYALADARKIAISSVAEAAGFPTFALVLLASLEDQAAYRAFVSRHAANEKLMNFPVHYYGGSALVHSSPLGPMPAQTFNAQPDAQFQIMRAGLLIGEADYLSILYNQTGWDDSIGAAAEAFLAQLDAGRTSSVGRLEDNWLFVYDQIAAWASPDELRQQMSSFDISTSVRHYAGNAQQLIDWMRAIRAVRPFLNGQSAERLTRPELLSSSFDWIGWTRLAEQIAAGTTPQALSELEQMMAAELLETAGREQDAINYAQLHMSPKLRLAFFRDVMKRLDRSCAGHGFTLGQSILLGGQMSFVFETDD